MTLNQALAIINAGKRSDGQEKHHYLVCGFEPLHLKTLFQAHLLERLPESRINVQHGIYGDLTGNLESARKSSATAAAVVFEWSDIDSRLGMRSSGGWSDNAKQDIITSAPQRYARIESALEQLAARMPVALAPPNLPLPPIGNTAGSQISRLELELEQQLASFLLRAAELPGVRVIQRSRLEPLIPEDERLDAKMELAAGFPYTVRFADALANALAGVLYQRPPKKGLITDLDETFWAGIVGESGPEGVSWHQEHHTQVHGLYQQMLGHLASCGVLVAVCSKNEISTVEAALARKDLLLDAKSSLFPVFANWEPKSQSVAQVLQTWNIADDAVVFVDDSAMELAEVKQAFPGITCLQFSGKDPAKMWHLLREMRDMFGKPLVLEEDRLRQASLRASAQIQKMGEAADNPDFLRSLQGAVTLDWRINPSDKRPSELINKTNQFNLNGLRITEGEWQRCLEDPQTILCVLSYTDKFGPLGKVAVLVGEQVDGMVKVSHWVMSCRAFSRSLELHILAGIFNHCGVQAIEFDFRKTERNQPLQEFFRDTGMLLDADKNPRVLRDQFLSRHQNLPHEVINLTP